MVPVGRGVQHEYQDKFEDFTCCVGTGMESHALHAYGIYYESGDKFWVSLYAPSVAKWDTKGVSVDVQTDFPIGDTVSIRITAKAATKFVLALRRPNWAGTGFSVKLNGQSLKSYPDPDSYVQISRTWKSGDRVEMILTKTLRTEPLPDNPNRLAVMWGPLVLAGDMGPELELPKEPESSGPSAPVFVTAAQRVDDWLKPAAGKPGTFRTTGVGLRDDVSFAPFYQLPRRRYAIYWDVYTPEEWRTKSAAYAAEQEKERKLEAATVAFVQPGQMQAERDANQQGEDSSPVQLAGRFGRQGKKWFSFDLPVESGHPLSLVVTFSNDARRDGVFSVQVDGTKVGERVVERRSPELDVHFDDVAYAVPSDLVRDKKKITVRFETTDETAIPGVFGVRLVRTDAQR